MQTQLLEVLRYTPRNRSCPTSARSFCALSFRLTGVGRLSTDKESLTARENDLLLVPAGLAYEHEATNEDIIVFHFNIYEEPFHRISVFTPADPLPFRAKFLEALQLWEQKETGYLYKAQAIFYEILALMEAEGMLHKSEKDPLMARCRAYIDAHFADPELNITALARRFGCSESYLRRRFAAAYGCVPKGYLTRKRMEYGRELIALGYYTQTEIAEKCGYKEVKYFRSAFKAYFGKSIREYLRTE